MYNSDPWAWISTDAAPSFMIDATDPKVLGWYLHLGTWHGRQGHHLGFVSMYPTSERSYDAGYDDQWTQLLSHGVSRFKYIAQNYKTAPSITPAAIFDVYQNLS
jgi:hypothetical protein